MNNVVTITWLTFQEARRRRVALAALVLGVLFVLLFAVGFGFVINEMKLEDVPQAFLRQAYSLLLIAGLYVTHFLTVMLAIFASVDTVAGEITSHTIQTIATKPIRRWEILLGKWLGYALMLTLYLLMIIGGLLLSVYLLSGYVPPNPLQGIGLLVLEALVLLSLSLLGGTRFSTLTNGVVLFMIYGLAFIGAWVEQIGSLLESETAVRIGVISSLLLPVEALWRRAAYLMQPTLSNSVPTPFSTGSVPSTAMVVYAVLYGAVMFGLAVRAFGRRDL